MRYFFSVLVLTFLAISVLAQDNADAIKQLKQENEELRRELADLKNALAEIKQMLPAASKPAEVPVTATTPAPAPKTKSEPVKSKFGVSMYGYLKLDASYDDSRVNPGNFARWVDSEALNPNDGEYNATANESRIGFDFTGPSAGKMKTSGKVELDFNGGGVENKTNPMLRHAYLQLDWPEADFSITAGQTWDIISPLLPTTLNYSNVWWGGNIGFRHPQIRISKGFKWGEGNRLLFQAAATRTIGHVASGMSGIDSGADSGQPTIQSRVALTIPGPAKQPITIGVSGHFGRDELDINTAGKSLLFNSWSGNMDIQVPFCKTILLKAELFRGSNMDDFNGGIGQGLNLVGLKAIRTSGGWAALTVSPCKNWKFNGGFGVEDPCNLDLNAGDRAFNAAGFGNCIVNLSDAVEVGFEYSHWQTRYINKAKGDANRVQASFIYRF